MELAHSTGSDHDLPLMSNTSDVTVRHFVLDLDCYMQEKKFSGSITLFLQLSPDGRNMQVFSIQDFQNQPKVNKAKTELLEFRPELANMNKQDIEKPSKGQQQQCTENFTECQAASDIVKCHKCEKPFELILDCCDIEINSVEAVESHKTSTDWLQLFSCDLNTSADEYLELSKQSPSRYLQHKTEKWSLVVWDPDVFRPADFARCIKIHYSTKPNGASLRWTIDQDGNPCVYTSGMWINNRSLMPCQEYGSLSTWQAVIRTPSRSMTVLMSGDDEACVSADGDKITYYYRSRMPLPTFALALAVGSWQCQVVSLNVNDVKGSIDSCTNQEQLQHSVDKHSQVYLQRTCFHEPQCYIQYCQTPVLPCKIFRPVSLLPRAVAEFGSMFPRYSIAIQKLLGPFPFPRVNILIYPSCSQDMAMSNPNLIFISQSMIAGDGSMRISLGHELSHYWFGLLIGARDWTEEWLSEGFATYVETIIESDVCQWSEEEYQEQAEIVDCLRYQTLLTELSHTNPELQTLCPNHQDKHEEDENSLGSLNYVKNGMNPYKLFTQVHYLKGYFLLRWLTKTVGHHGMRRLLREYVIQGHGQMVTSHEFLTLAFNTFPELGSHQNINDLYHDWLDCPGLPPKLDNCTPSKTNRLYQMVISDLQQLKGLNRSFKYHKKRAKRHKSSFDVHSLNSKQLLLLLNTLLKEPALCKQTLTYVRQHYQLSKTNAEVQHRWFELVIKYRYTQAYRDLARYLTEHQAMGVYLYGEMVITRCRRLMSIAEKVFHEISSDMESTTRKIMQRMLYG